MKKIHSKLGLGLALAGGGALLGIAALITPLIASAQEATTTPVITAVVATPTDTTANIMWTTDVSSNSQIEFGSTTSYGTFSALDPTEVTGHSETISGLTPDTTYHFAVLSQTGSSSQAVSPDQTFMTMMSSTTASSTAPNISSIVVSPSDTSATITWSTDVPATDQVAYGTSAGDYTASSTLNSSLNTTHSTTISGLVADTEYHFAVMSNNSSAMNSTSADETFMTLMSSTTGTTTGTGTTTTDEQSIITQIDSLWTQLQSLLSQLNMLTGGSAGATIWNVPGITGTGSSTPPVSGSGASPSIDQQGQTVSAGGTIDFSGRNFDHEQNVTVMEGGQTVATGHADGGGNFSTGSLTVPSTAGTYTYLFTDTGGASANATITVQ